MKRLFCTVVLFSLSTASFAAHCQADAKAIYAGLAKATLSDAQKSEIMSLRDKGMAQHKSGDHKDAVDTLSEAMRILLNGME